MNGVVEIVKCLNREFMSAGEDLLRRLNLSGVNDSQLPRNISSWVDVVTRSFLPLMPKNHLDYKIINEMRSRYVKNQDILLPSASTDIRKLLDHWNIAYQCAIAFLNADVRDVPPQNLASIYYEQLNKSTTYIATDLIKKVKRERGWKDHQNCYAPYLRKDIHVGT